MRSGNWQPAEDFLQTPDRYELAVEPARSHYNQLTAEASKTTEDHTFGVIGSRGFYGIGGVQPPKTVDLE